MLEIEVKCRVESLDPVRLRLMAWGAQPTSPIDEADHYFNAPDRDFGQTDEALRVRRIGPTNRVTYKGPKLPGPTKTRKEIEVGLADGDDAASDFCRLLESLGYRPTAVVHKRRTEYRLEREKFGVGVCLDDVENVGSFVEVEIVAPDGEREAADRVLMQLCQELGLENFERRSYLEMLLERLGRL